MGKKIVALLLIIVFSFSSILAYGYNKSKTREKEEEKTVALNDVIEINTKDIKSTKDKVALDSGTNIGSGGDGGGNYEDNTGKGTSITGSIRDEGVRVTLVESKTGKILTRPIDLANDPMPVTRWFGAVCKLSYLGIGNNKISLKGQNLNNGTYNYKKPDKKLPPIVNGNLQTIKNYFGSEKFANYFSYLTGFDYDNLISGDYKLIIEPIGYPKINGEYVACTATELALLDQQKNGAIRKKLADFSHKNLPLAMFLEQDDFGIKAFSGSTTSRQSNDIIISQLGIGIVYFNGIPKPPEEIPVPEYTYRTNTTVFTSLTGLPTNYVVSGNSSNGYNVTPTTVSFSLSDTTNKAKIIDSKTTAYRADDTVWVKWETPEKPKNMEVIAQITYRDQEEDDSQKGYHWVTRNETIRIPIEIVQITEKTPPNPVADDRNDSWQMTKKPQIGKDTLENGWNEYEYEIDTKEIYNNKGEWVRTEYKLVWIKHYYTVKLKSKIDVYPDPLCKTYKRDGYGNYTMKSGYGIRQDVEGELQRIVKTTSDTFFDGTRINKEELHTIAVPIQNGVSFFSDFYFKDYFRLLTISNKKNRTNTLSFKNNRFSTYNNPTHFTPIWYPDNEYYIVNTYVFDAWTPGGMLGSNLSGSIYIYGNLWDDWYVQRLPEDYDYYTNNYGFGF